MKSLHEQADPGPGGSDHLRQFFVRNPKLDANTARVFLAHCPGQLQQCLAQPLLAIDGHEIGDDLLLVGDAHGKVTHEPLP